MAAFTPLRAQDVRKTLGVHSDMTQGNWSSVPNMITSAQYAGIWTLRMSPPNPGNWTAELMNTIPPSGLKLEFTADTGSSPAVNVSSIATFVTNFPGSVLFVEGPNEPDNFPFSYGGQTGVPAAQLWQTDFFNGMRANGATSAIKISGMAAYPQLAAASDWNNLHIYPNHGNQPRPFIVTQITDQLAVDPGKGYVITEMGYYTVPGFETPGTFWTGINEAAHAKLILNCWMDTVHTGGFNFGLYSLRDWVVTEPPTDIGAHFGVFRTDDTPKPAAVALHNLTTIFNDAGGTATSFTPAAITFTTTALTDVYQLVLQKSSGEYLLVFWREPEVWDEATDSEVFPAGATFSVALATPSAYSIYDPLVSATATSTGTATSNVVVTVVDHPVVVQIGAAVVAGASVTRTVARTVQGWSTGFAAGDLNSLASGAQKTSSLTAPQIDNTSGAALSVQFELTLGALSPGAMANVVVFLIPETQIAAAYVTGGDTVALDRHPWSDYPHAAIALRQTASSAQTNRSRRVSINNERYKVAVLNRSGTTFAASGNQVSWRLSTEVVA